MKQDVVIQVRANKEERDQANEILRELNTNISSVVNMLLKQVILTRCIPFTVALPQEELSDNTEALSDTTDVDIPSTISGEQDSYSTAPISGSYADTSDIDKYVDMFDNPENTNSHRFSSTGSESDAFSDFINMGI